MINPNEGKPIYDIVKDNLAWIVAMVSSSGFFAYLFPHILRQRKSKREKSIDLDTLITTAANNITETIEKRYKELLAQQTAMHGLQKSMHEYEVSTLKEHHKNEMTSIIDSHRREKEDLIRDFNSQINGLNNKIDDLSKELTQYKRKN